MRKLFILTTLLLSSPLFADSSARASLVKSGSGVGNRTKVWPICLFVEAGATPSAKEVGNSLIAEAKACGVTAMVNPIPVNNLPSTSKALADSALRFCKPETRFKAAGERASIIVITKRQGAGREFCDLDPDKVSSVGCGQYAGPTDSSLKSKMIHTVGWADNPKANASAVSIIDAGPRAVQEAQKWGMGAGMMGLPVGGTIGNGVGRSDEGAGVDWALNNKWTPDACAIMQAKAFILNANLPPKLMEGPVYSGPGVDIQKITPDHSTGAKTVRVQDAGPKGAGGARGAGGGAGAGLGAENVSGAGAIGAGSPVGTVNVQAAGPEGVDGAKGASANRIEHDETRSRANANTGMYGAGEGTLGGAASSEAIPAAGHGQNMGGKSALEGIAPTTPAVTPARSAAPASPTVIAPAKAKESSMDGDFFNSKPTDTNSDSAPSRRGKR
jgi:hypothetical protein